MGPDDMNSIDCIYRGNCLPLGGQSVWAASPPTPTPDNGDDDDGDDNKIVLFAMAMDSRSEIYDITNGQTGVTLSIFLSALHTLYHSHQHHSSPSANANGNANGNPKTFHHDNDNDNDHSSSFSASALNSSYINHTRFVVAFFQGEQWGRSGSRSWVSDIQEFRCMQEVGREDSPFNDRMCTSPVKVGVVLSEWSGIDSWW